MVRKVEGYKNIYIVLLTAITGTLARAACTVNSKLVNSCRYSFTSTSFLSSSFIPLPFLTHIHTHHPADLNTIDLFSTLLFCSLSLLFPLLLLFSSLILCRPWLGAAANDYPGHTGTSIRDRITDHETRIGRQLDLGTPLSSHLSSLLIFNPLFLLFLLFFFLVHDYSNPGSVLNTNQIYYALRPNTTLLLNYKPSLSWAAASGGNASVNAQIDALANR